MAGQPDIRLFLGSQRYGSQLLAQARQLQQQWAVLVCPRDDPGLGRLTTVAGADVSYGRFEKTGYAAIVVLDWPAMQTVVATGSACGRIDFPYIPGLLSFRELPLLLEAWEQLETRPDLVICDGQGIAHPRRLGIAAHFGLETGVPVIGCAKSRLIGTHDPLPPERGAWVTLWDQGEEIGAVVRTRSRCRPLYVSVGHRIALPRAREIILAAARWRQPEPIRAAHAEVNRLRRRDMLNKEATEARHEDSA